MGKSQHCQRKLLYFVNTLIWQLCATMMSWVGCLLKDSELFILFAENSQILLKISVIPILLTFMCLVGDLDIKNYLFHGICRVTKYQYRKNGYGFQGSYFSIFFLYNNLYLLEFLKELKKKLILLDFRENYRSIFYKKRAF